MSNNLVSIIMHSYNYGHFVEETIRSVQAQAYWGWELIDFINNIKCQHN